MTIGNDRLVMLVAKRVECCPHERREDNGGKGQGGCDDGDPHTVDDVADPARLSLNGVRFANLYDFGDGWNHAVVIEGKMPRVDGPPEDCGGPGGDQDLFAILADPNHPDRDDWIEPIDDEFDPEAFSLDQVNLILFARFP